MLRQTAQNEWVANAEIRLESGETWVLNYYIQSVNSGEGITLYGLKIEKSTPEGVLFESEETGSITESYDEALIMAKAFAKGSVPPVVLLEMADEWYSEIEENSLLLLT
ncbi:MAG: DUF6514 family protein [Defluviitaleaceae bacterium]|nr:DUF6514 family protein [Defluviitaleaceae bacterium]